MHIAANPQDPRRERAISELARHQNAVVALWQLHPIGISTDAAHGRVAAGRLHRVHHGVFSVVHPDLLTRNGRYMAAVLACGPGAVLSHRSAASLYNLKLRSENAIDVTAPGSRGRDRDGIRVHSAAMLAPQDVTLIDDIPVTTLARTLLDVAGDASRRELERALDQGEQQRLLDTALIDDVLARANGRRGTKALESDRRRDQRLANARLPSHPLHVASGHPRAAPRRSHRHSPAPAL